MNLSIENVINVSVSQAGQGAGEYNTSNLSLFTRDPHAPSFGDSGYKIYLSPSEVGIDFGTDSMTYKKALAVFSQQPNILAGGGYLVVIPLLHTDEIPEVPEVVAVTAVKKLAFDGVPDSGSYKISYLEQETSALSFDATDGDIQTALRLLDGLDDVVVDNSKEITFIGVSGPVTIGIVENTVVDGGASPVGVLITDEVVGVAYEPAIPAVPAYDESLKDGILRSLGIVEYFGVMASFLVDNLSEVAETIQPLNKIGFFGSNDSDDIEPEGKFDLIRQASYFKARCLFYGSEDEESVLRFVAAYAGRALSVNFNGSNTTSTMHLKDLIGVIPDQSMNQTLLGKASAAGADCYISIQGVPKTFTSGANRFFDDVYNLLWFVGAIQIAGFNTLAQTSTKIAQTEQGVDSLKSAYRVVCERAINNEFIAAGHWNSPDTFGIQEDFFDNISQRGYYIYSTPLSKQAPADRADRKAPIIQLAIKYAGAIHSGTVIVNVNQ